MALKSQLELGLGKLNVGTYLYLRIEGFVEQGVAFS
jgi:hypothetical protein